MANLILGLDPTGKHKEISVNTAGEVVVDASGIPGGDAISNRLNVSDSYLPYPVSADGLVIDGPCEVSSVHCQTSSSGLVTLIDGTTAAGQKVFGGGGASGVAFAENDTKSITLNGAARLMNGLYIDISGTFTGIIWARPL